MKIISDDEKFLIEQANKALASLTAFNPNLASHKVREDTDAKIQELSSFILGRLKEKLADLQAA